MSNKQQSLIDTICLSIMTWVGTAFTWFANNLDFMSRLVTFILTVVAGFFTIRQSIIATRKLKKEMEDDGE